jgi:hypothetical protein
MISVSSDLIGSHHGRFDEKKVECGKLSRERRI